MNLKIYEWYARLGNNIIQLLNVRRIDEMAIANA